MAPIGNAVFATLLLNDAYLPGAMVLAHSLKDRGAKGKLVALVVLGKLSATTLSHLQTVYDDIVPVKQILNKLPANLYLMDRPDLISVFTKIQLWSQTQYKRIVYMDADVVALRAPNELLTMDTEFAAVPDIGWPDCFNSGVMVLNPNMADYYSLLALAERGISFDGGDQGLLNMHFTQWDRLSFTYNCTPSGNYQYVPAYRHFQSSINMVHFIGRDKPWTMGRENRFNHGVYGELLARWWAVYDRHYRTQETVYYSGNWQDAPKKVQDYVRGEEVMYLPAYQAPPPGLQPISTHQVQQQQQQSNHQPPSSINVLPPAAEESMGDQPTLEEQINKEQYEPTPTVHQRRFSAPHADWEPARAPPPVNSKPEASNFPTQTYDFSSDVKLFQPPAAYPEAPRDMWYEVPKKAEPAPKPKPIFPWETRAPKPTRVFIEPRAPSPPPELLAMHSSVEPTSMVSNDQSTERGVEAIERHSVSTDQTDSAADNIDPTPAPYVDPWTTFNQRSNAWDDMPEITKYVQALHPPKKGKIQVLHHTPSTSIGGPGDFTFPSLKPERRLSIKVTDFPSAIERPSLPVTPAPIRRPTFWGESEESELSGELPTAEGVPKQEEWVRRFSSYPTPAFASILPHIRESDGVLLFQCQHCGEQNPIAKLEELQRLQSATLLEKADMTESRDPPKRELPDSASKDEVEAAVDKAYSPTSTRPLKPILKEPKFELPEPSTVTTAATATASMEDQQVVNNKVSETAKEGTVHDEVTLNETTKSEAAEVKVALQTIRQDVVEEAERKVEYVQG